MFEVNEIKVNFTLTYISVYYLNLTRYRWLINFPSLVFSGSSWSLMERVRLLIWNSRLLEFKKKTTEIANNLAAIFLLQGQK